MSNQPGTGKYERLLERCRGLEPIPTAVAHPCEESALSGAIEAARLGLIAPILIGPAAKIAAVAASLGGRLDGYPGGGRRRTATPPPPSRSSWCARAEPSC